LNAVARMLTPDDICLDVELADKPQLFEKIGLLMEQRYGLAHDFIARGLARREAAGSTGLGQGVALPHARFKGLTQTRAIYLRPKLPMPFASPDDMPVTDILALLVPEPASNAHLELLAEAAQMFSDRRFREQLRACIEVREVKDRFDAWTPAAPGASPR